MCFKREQITEICSKSSSKECKFFWNLLAFVRVNRILDGDSNQGAFGVNALPKICQSNRNATPTSSMGPYL